MTATFVQLRHVVYLLVLLQCFLCVANASGVWRGYPTTGSAEMGKVDQVLRGRVARAHEQIAVMNGCLSALKEEMKLCEEGSRRAAAVAKNIRAIVKEFEEMKKKRGEDWEPFEWIGENTNRIVKSINEFGSVRLSFIDMILVEGACKEQLANFSGDMEGLDDARKRFLEVYEDVLREGPGIMRLDENSRKASQMLTDLTERIGAEDGELGPIQKAMEVMADTSGAVEALKQSLGDETELVAILEAMKDAELRKRAEERKDTITNKLNRAKAKAKKDLSRVQGGLVEEEEGEKRKKGGHQRRERLG